MLLLSEDPKMYLYAFIAIAALTNFAFANNNSAFGFNANTYLVFEGVPFSNHPSIVGNPQARNHRIEINPQADDPQTYCPTRVQMAGQCPTPTPSSIKTQFNTTLDQGGPMGEVYMNVAVPGGQQLYVEKDGIAAPKPLLISLNQLVRLTAIHISA